MSLEKNRKNLMQKARRWANFLTFLPGVEAIFLSGSVAQGNVSKNSDIDFFVVARSGQIFTARFFINALLTVSFQLANNEKNNAGKICPNHFITTGDLEIKEKDAYAARLFSHNIFLSGQRAVWDLFIKTNQDWIATFGDRFQSKPFGGSILKKEKKLNRVWMKFESWAKYFQTTKIEKNRKNLPQNAKVILNDFEIRLHPHPKNTSFVSSTKP